MIPSLRLPFLRTAETLIVSSIARRHEFPAIGANAIRCHRPAQLGGGIATMPILPEEWPPAVVGMLIAYIIMNSESKRRGRPPTCLRQAARREDDG